MTNAQARRIAKLQKPGIHSLTLDEIENLFVFNEHRKKLFQGLKKALENLVSAGVQDVYIDGSFISEKEVPNDIDGCWLPNPSTVSSKIDPVLLDFSYSRKKMKEKYGVDFFPANCIEGPSGEPFLKFFQMDRDGKPKGIIKIE